MTINNVDRFKEKIARGELCVGTTVSFTDPAISELIGDADERIDSGVTFVALPSNDRLLDNLTLSSPALTPNGDGIHDEVILSFDLLKIIDPRPVELTVYDLAGRRVVTASDASVSAGRISLRWDGRTPGGQLVSPGTYILGIRVRGDAYERVQHRIVTVVY